MRLPCLTKKILTILGVGITVYFVILFLFFFCASFTEFDADLCRSTSSRFCRAALYYERTHPAHEILLGLIGIAIGVYISLVIDKKQRERETDIDGALKKLSVATEEVQKTTNALVPNVWVIEKVDDLFREIGYVIEHAKGEKFKHRNRIFGSNKQGLNNELIIMNLSASFGYYLTFDCDYVLGLEREMADEKHFERVLQKLATENGLTYNDRRKPQLKKQRSNHTKIRSCIRNKDAHKKQSSGKDHPKVKYMTLDPGLHSVENYYRKNYLAETLSTSIVKEYKDDAKNLEFGEEIKSELAGDGISARKLLLVPDTLLNGNDGGEKKETIERLKEHLIAQQKGDIADLIEWGVDVIPCESIPMQMFLSVPKGNGSDIGVVNGCNKREDEALGVIMFVNQYTLPKISYISAFGTSDIKNIQAFKAIFDSYNEDIEKAKASAPVSNSN